MSTRSSRAKKLFAEWLEDRCNPSGLSADEQYFLELINRARANPAAEAARFGIDLNEGLFPGTISSNGVSPLAPNQALQSSIESHLSYLGSTGLFTHFGANGTQVIDRAGINGYYTPYMGEN